VIRCSSRWAGYAIALTSFTTYKVVQMRCLPGVLRVQLR
jgi:hypothetical protein